MRELNINEVQAVSGAFITPKAVDVAINSFIAPAGIGMATTFVLGAAATSLPYYLYTQSN